MTTIIEVACVVYVSGCLLAVGLDLVLYRSFQPKRGRRRA